MKRQEALQRFLEIGLTEYEAKVLLSLYVTGQAKATEVSNASGVPKAKIYNVLDELCNKRLIKMHSTKPSTYSPLDPEELFSRLKKLEKGHFLDKEKNINATKKHIGKELAGLYHKSQTTSAHQELVEIIKLGEPSLFETKNIINKAKKVLLFMSQAFEHFDAVKKDIDTAIKKGVEVQVVLGTRKTLKKEGLKKYESTLSELRKRRTKVKFTDSVLNLRYTLSDPLDKKTCGCILVVKEYDIPLSVRSAIYSDNQSFVKGMAEHFRSYWEK
ncbi:MAG: helix-turn-helix domain-containing protein [archaeon]